IDLGLDIVGTAHLDSAFAGTVLVDPEIDRLGLDTDIDHLGSAFADTVLDLGLTIGLVLDLDTADIVPDLDSAIDLVLGWDIADTDPVLDLAKADNHHFGYHC